MTTYKDIWVYVEVKNDAPLMVTLELLAKARELSKKSGDKVVAIVLSDNNLDISSTLIAYGADKVIRVTSPLLAQFKTRTVAQAFTDLINKYHPSILLFGATYEGRDLAPRIQAKLQTGLTADCLELAIDEQGLLVQTKPSYGDNIMCNIVCPEKRPQMSTVRPKIFSPLIKDPSRIGEVIVEPVNLQPENDFEIIGTQAKTCSSCTISSADKIIAIGRGLDKEEYIKQAECLAELMGASVGVTRPLTGHSTFTHDDQIGQSGLTVKPNFIINFAISGSVQYTVGMQDAKLIISVNKNPDAPIFGLSHYGYVGDATRVISCLIEEMKRLTK